MDEVDTVKREVSIKGQWVDRIVKDPDLSEREKLLLLVISNFMNRSGIAFVNRMNVAAYSGISSAKIKSMVESLAERHYLSVRFTLPGTNTKNSPNYRKFEVHGLIEADG
jgi:hypothetical protein